MSASNELQASRDALLKTSAYKRISRLFDEGSFQEIDAYAKSGDEYAEAAAGRGTIEGCPVYAYVQNPDICGGAMSKAQAQKIKKVYDLALKAGAPVIGVFDSNGGRLDEGAAMMAAYGEILLASNNLSGVVPQIALVLGPCVGTSAMIAAGADFVVMSDKGELTLDTAGADASAKEAMSAGVCHIAAGSEDDAIAAVRNLLVKLPSNNLCGAPVVDFAGVAAAGVTVAGMKAADAVKAMADEGSFVELSHDFGSCVCTGLAAMNGLTVGMVALDGTVCGDGCSKAARFVRFCDAFSLPVVTAVHADGFTSVREACKLSNAYSEATTAKTTVICGHAVGAVYIAVAGRGANADITLAWPDAVVSPLAPATACMFTCSDKLAGSADPVHDREKLIEEYAKTECTPFKAAAEGFIEDIVLPEETRAKVLGALDMLAGKRVQRLAKKHANIQL